MKHVVEWKRLGAGLLAVLCVLAAGRALYRAGAPGSRQSPSAPPVPAWRDLPAGAHEKRSKKLADLAVEKIQAGEFRAAEGLLRRALAADRYNPEALISLCGVLARENRKAEALAKCEAASSAVHASPKKSLPELRMIASEAEFASYGLLLSLGREHEAKETLCRCRKLAPRGWPGLAAADAELKKFPGFSGCLGL